MNKYLIYTGTVTFAIKGRDILRKNEVQANIQKVQNNHDHAGCGYAIIAIGNIEYIKSLLSGGGVKILEIEAI